MKVIKQFSFVCMTMLIFAACHHHHDDGNTYQQEETLPSISSEKIVSLNMFSTDIEIPSFKPVEWLSVEKLTYSSGIPQIKLKATENLTSENRICNVEIIAVSKDKIVLTVTQLKRNGDIQNSQSDQPAFIRHK